MTASRLEAMRGACVSPRMTEDGVRKEAGRRDVVSQSEASLENPFPRSIKSADGRLTRARLVQERLPLSLLPIRPYDHIPFPLRAKAGGGSQREARAAVPAWTRRAPMQFRTVNHGFTNFVAFPSLSLSLSLLAFLLFPCPHTEKASPRSTRREPRPSLTRCSQLACNP